MKSPMTQALMMLLAIVFAVALSLTVALLCISFLREENTQPPRVEDTSAPIALPPPTDTLESTTYPDILTTAPPPVVDEPEVELGNGLAFVSNGDGSCTLTGIGTCTDACVVIPEYAPNGERVTSISARALYGCRQINAIQIPASVESIGSLAFSNCQNLVYISVSEENEEFCDMDGILYTSDGRALLLYPPMRAGSTVTISVVTTEIMEMAFYNCTYLKQIYYTGTPAQWESIAIGSKNYSLIASAKTFSVTK